VTELEIIPETGKTPLGWRILVAILLFLLPVPFSPWWVGIVCCAVIGVLIARVLLIKHSSK
jgi:hypothetical protein